MRNWMDVKLKELPMGSKLIMGLNPPFGVHGKDANMFVKKALEFQPKLLILIVPPDTERLDNNQPPYDLVWEDKNFLLGKSFYLPGPLDVNGRQMDQ
ncbi:protein ENHANCED DOWNY MILDEW 2-like isoform X3 [Neltuma alba]|uniref:protein ENHANCED DOWNY MILDEW 2-like isoform X3 n=1 Tax=Neltuma alba TaxID=207710 RepID=UPI0010A30FF8|nr:protein ENHANCED DOWNY MILDEW 2-like isoform X3 [Prosopis alba]